MWTPPKIWENGECWIIGGGPSIPHEFGVPKDVIDAVHAGEAPISTYSPYFSSIHEKHIIGVNAAFLLGDWMDVVFFGDSKFYRLYRDQLRAYGKLMVTCNDKVFSFTDDHDVKHMRKDNRKPYGISARPGFVAWNGNSGAAAISLACQLGARRIILLGFDMTAKDNYQHFHGAYHKGKQPDNRRYPFPRHSRGFADIAKDSKRLGVEIFNLSAISTLPHFKKISVKDVL